MEILWERKGATVREVVEALPKGKSKAYTTVLTTLRILEKKGYVRHEKRGRAYVYHPIIGRGEARRTAVRCILSRFFEDSPELLVLHLLAHEQIDPQQLERLKRLIEESGEEALDE